MRIAYSMFCWLALLATGCEQQPAAAPTSAPSPQHLPTTRMSLGSQQYDVQIADEEPEREVGLMHRRDMPAGEGMIFVFAESLPRGFWMKNTLIPLDIVFLTEDGRVVSMHRMLPLNLRSTYSKGAAKYAIELNEGELAKTGLREGDRIDIPPVARNSKD